MTRRDIAQLVLTRLALLVLLVTITSAATFALLYLAPGDPVSILLAGQPTTPEYRAAVEAQYHFDESLPAQMWHWMGRVIQLDLGTSITSGESVASLVASRAATSALLGVYASVIALGVGIPLGCVAAARRERLSDHGITALAICGSCVPSFVLGIGLLYVFAVVLEWFPSFGEGSGPMDRLWHLTLPAVTLAVAIMASLIKITRASMVRELQQDYVPFARGRGVSWRQVWSRYALRSGVIPVLTASGVLLSNAVSGAVVVEYTFQINGLGTLLVQSVQAKDILVVQGVAIVISAMLIAANLLVDVLYPLVDPRVRGRRRVRAST